MNTRHLRPEDLVGKRWRAYLRESSQDQAEKWGPERQRVDLTRAAAELGLVPSEPTFYERTGTGEVQSDELGRALADAGQYDVLLVLTTSRFARNVTEARRRKAQFAAAGIPIYFVQDRIVSGARSSRLLEGVREVIDEEENEQRRFFIAGGLRQRQASGRWVGIIPVGYRRQLVDFPDGTRGWDGALELDPVLAKIVRRIYDEAAAGFGCRRIAVGLNAEGLRTNHGRLWAYGTVHDILTNGVYAGRMLRYRRVGSLAYYEADGADGRADLGMLLPPIVDETLWEQVQEAARGRLTRGVSSPSGRTYPLSNVLRCAKCGYAMTGVNNSVHRYYRCAGRTRFRLCDAAAIRADIAEGQFADWIGSYHLPADWRTEIARTSLERVKVDERDRRINADERLKRLRDLYAWGDLSKDDYQRQSSEIKSAMTVVRPGLAGLVSVAEAIRNLGPAWRSAPAEVQAAVPPLMLKSATVEDARISEWVVRAELRPLLELCVPDDTRNYLSVAGYPAVRFSA